MALSFRITHQEVIYEHTGLGDAEEIGGEGYIAPCSNSLAVLVYTPSPVSARIRAFHPGSGAVYYDDELLSHSGGDIRGRNVTTTPDGRAFGTVTTDFPNTVHVFTADAAGWQSASYLTAGSVRVEPHTDGAPGTGYFHVQPLPATGLPRPQLYTVDLDDLSVSITGVSGPSGSEISSVPFRGGAVAASPGVVTGNMALFRPGIGWQTHSPGTPLARAWTAENETVALRGDGPGLGVFTRVAYDPAGNTFTLMPLGWRMPIVPSSSPSDLPPGEHVTGGFGGSQGVASLTPEAVYSWGVAVVDADYDESGLQNPYKWHIHSTNPAGEFAMLDFQYPGPFAPDLVDFNSFTNYHLADIKVWGSNWAACLTGSSGLYDPGVDDTYWHGVIIVLTGTFGGGWNIGWLGAPGVSPLSVPAARGAPSAMGRSVAEPHHHRRELVQFPDGTTEVLPAGRRA